MPAVTSRLLGVVAAALTALLLSALPASASDLEDYAVALRAYESHDYASAVLYFEVLVGGDTPRLESAALVIEARKYLGAAYLLEGRRDAARVQFERLLRAEPEYVIDTLRFPIEVIELFESTRERLVFEREQEAARAALEADLAAERARARALLDVAGARVDTYVEHSRLLALLPAGVGQFQNGDEGAGWAFLVSESVLVVAGVGALGWWIAVNDQAADARAAGTAFDTDAANRLTLGLQIVNVVTLSSALVLALSGILEAQLNFVPGHTVSTHISIPPELMEPEDEEVPTDPAPSVSFGLTSLSVSF